MTRVFESPLRAFLLWLGTCLFVFYSLNLYATRPVPVDVSAFRGDGMDEEQILVQAIQAADDLRPNLWWVNEKQPYLVLDPSLKNRVDPAFFSNRDVHIQASGATVIGWIQPVPATATP